MRVDGLDMKAAALLSGGIDSPVACHLMLSRGAEVHLLHMDNQPYADASSTDKVVKIAQHLKNLHPNAASLNSLHILPFGSTAQKSIHGNCNPHYQCVLCKRMMYRAAEAFCNQIGASTIITGDSLGQVASQTLRNLKVMSTATDHPVVRPLIGLDKNEIIEISKGAGLYELSIERAVGCTLAPKKPKTFADMQKVMHEEQKIDISRIISSAIKARKEINLE